MQHPNAQHLDGDTLRPILEHPDLARPAAELFWQVERSPDPQSYVSTALFTLAGVLPCSQMALATARQGRWAVVEQIGGLQALPDDLIAEAADREATCTHDGWAATPLSMRGSPQEVVLARLADDAELRRRFEQLVSILAEALGAVRRRYAQQTRVRDLETILQIANRWNQTQEVEPLLVQIAEAATRLLAADRASIFLWDKTNHLLVGRPALGVQGGELRIPDDRGVVGQVIQTGQPRRVDAATEPEAIDRQVDAQLHYRTNMLLCVPLRGRDGELFGAFEVLNKHSGNFTDDDQTLAVELAAHAAVALENVQQRQRLLATRRQMTDQAAEGIRMIGKSPVIEALRSTVRRVADTELAVLLLGENGTGKEVVAQSIHYLSRRRDQPFVAVNCAAIPDTLAESELFGHERGAFTDARDARQGKFELAADGTLFLDEIGDLSLGAQAKLLRVLEEKVLVRLGGSQPIATNARVLAATNQNLAEMVREKQFREDLYFRLNVVTLEIPPLRDRPGDIMLLAGHFLADFCQKARRKIPVFTPEAEDRMKSHPWPGNVRELRNLMERLAYLTTGEQIDVEDLAFTLSPRQGDAGGPADLDRSLNQATAEFQRRYIRRLIERCDGNMSHAAEQAGLHRSNLYRKMRQLGMEPPAGCDRTKHRL